MLARALIVVLVILNLAVALWWWRQPSPSAAPLPAWPDAPRLHALDAAPRATAHATGTTAAICLRIGPFADATAATAVRMRLPVGLEPLPAPVAPTGGHWLHLRQHGALDTHALDALIRGAGVAWRAEPCPSSAAATPASPGPAKLAPSPL